jgi:hypothetical protein
MSNLLNLLSLPAKSPLVTLIRGNGFLNLNPILYAAPTYFNLIYCKSPKFAVFTRMFPVILLVFSYTQRSNLGNSIKAELTTERR